jgi:hypothetical protein
MSIPMATYSLDELVAEAEAEAGAIYELAGTGLPFLTEDQLEQLKRMDPTWHEEDQ